MNQLRDFLSMPAEEVLFEAASLAGHAPSVANSQPWRWRIRHNVLELRYDTWRQLTAADPDGRLMIMSCGAALHHAVVALGVLGVTVTLDRLPDPDDPPLLARLTLAGRHVVTEADMRLQNAIRSRRTDRRPFSGDPLSADVTAALGRVAEPFAVRVHAFERSDIGYLALAARAAAMIENRDVRYREELAAWTTGHDVLAGDGVPAAVAVPQVSRAVPVRDFAPGGVPGLDPGPGDDRNATYLALLTETDTIRDWLRTGEAVSAVLLTATAAGLASAIMSNLIEVPGARALIRGLIVTEAYPQIALRVGWNTGAPPVPPTPRRRPADYIEVVTGR